MPGSHALAAAHSQAGVVFFGQQGHVLGRSVRRARYRTGPAPVSPLQGGDPVASPPSRPVDVPPAKKRSLAAAFSSAEEEDQPKRRLIPLQYTAEELKAAQAANAAAAGASIFVYSCTEEKPIMHTMTALSPVWLHMPSLCAPAAMLHQQQCCTKSHRLEHGPFCLCVDLMSLVTCSLCAQGLAAQSHGPA